MIRTPVRRPTGDREERGSIVMVMLMIMVLTAIAGTVTITAASELTFGRVVASRNTALQGALAGNQAVTAEIKAAVLAGVSTQNGNVSYTALPCALTGTTNATGGSSWTAKAVYQAQNSAGTVQTLTCSNGQGVTGISNGYHLTQAYVTSCSPTTACPSDPTQPLTGSGARRTVSTYQFQTTNANVAGGVITAESGLECMVASYNNGQNASGGISLDTTTSCGSSSPYSSLEQFQYTANWNLQIALNGIDYCIQDPNTSGATPSLTTNCSGSVAQWGVDDSTDIEGVSSTSTPAGGPNGLCIDNALASISAVSLTEAGATMGGCGPTPWQYSPTVGSGGAAPASGQSIGPTQQFVNYDEFGRCMDVTNQNVNWTFLIDYTCKQFPDTTNYPLWNQRFCFEQLGANSSNGYPEGLVYTPYVAGKAAPCGVPGGSGATGTTTGPPAAPYCLKSPLATATASDSNVVTVTSCSLPTAGSGVAGVASNLLWTTWGANGTAANTYTWTDSAGNCLEANTANALYASSTSLTDSNPNGAVSGAFSIIQVDTCNGSYEQKWNAPANLGKSQTVNTHEGTGTGSVTSP